MFRVIFASICIWLVFGGTGNVGAEATDNGGGRGQSSTTRYYKLYTPAIAREAASASNSNSEPGAKDPCLGPPVKVTGGEGVPPLTSVSGGVVYELYARVTSCAESTGGGTVFFYLPRVRVEDLIPALEKQIEALVPAPVTTFRPFDAKFGWTYVNVEVDFRVDPVSVQPVSVSDSLTNGVVTVSATLTATPVWVGFSPGEPRGKDVWCSPAGALARYDPARPGECSYKYRNSSAISANGRTFTTTTTTRWELQVDASDGPRTLEPFELSSTDELGVAEVQALVTCTGPLPEQGGC